MEKSILTLEEFKVIWKQYTQKFLLRLSTIIKMGLKEVIQMDTAKNQLVLDMDLKMTSYEQNYMEKEKMLLHF